MNFDNRRYTDRIRELTQRAQTGNPYRDDCSIGEVCYTDMLEVYLYQHRQLGMPEEALAKKVITLKRKLLQYYQLEECSVEAARRRNRYSEVFSEIERHGCPLCRKVIRIFDGREK